MTSKPRVFVASSTEGIVYAQAVFSCLERDTEPSLWTHDLFEASSTFIESLEQVLATHDIGVVVFTPDDARVMRAQSSRIPRDNAVFELGLLMGHLGRKNVFVICPEDDAISLPTDLSGLVRLNYSTRQDSNYTAAVSTACRRIVDRLSMRRSQLQHVAFWNNVQERHRDRSDLRSQIEQTKTTIFVSGISLRYLAIYCASQLKDALARQVNLEVLIPSDEADLFEFYELHKPHAADEIRLSHLAWKEFAESLEEHQRSRLTVVTTKVPLTHSVGLYDGPIFVNPFCIGLNSAELPSIRIEPNMTAYRAYITDALEHVTRGEQLCGGREPSILSALGRGN